MKLVLGSEIVRSYKRLAYTPWYALAEFVDNSTQSFIANKSAMQSVYETEGKSLFVEITYSKSESGDYITIFDNSIGMSADELQKALIIGRPPVDTNGRSRYGLGLKTASCWLGNLWTLTTKKLNSTQELTITFDVEKVALGDVDLQLHKEEAPANEHYTRITIKQLNSRLSPRTIGKIKTYLRSIYRLDIDDNMLMLYWGDELLQWNYNKEIFSRLIKRDGQPVKRDFSFTVDEKRVHGWAGVLDKGSRRDAGFSVIQASRVIEGWPDAYRPETLFGEQEGGTNNLVNQRLIGELFVEGFQVSHTKDKILFTVNEKEELEDSLAEELSDLKEIAETHRSRVKNTIAHSIASDEAIKLFNTEIHSSAFKQTVKELVVPENEDLVAHNKTYHNRVIGSNEIAFNVQLDDLEINVYLSQDSSKEDPYLTVYDVESNVIDIIINKSHPHWRQLENANSILNFIRHCVYDGVAEWKAAAEDSLYPDTVKFLKDELLRVPMRMQASE